MVKYSLSPNQIPRADPEGFSKGSGYISPYILTLIIVQTLSISKNDTYSIVLPGWAILVELIFCFALAAGPIFSSIRHYTIIKTNTSIFKLSICHINF